MSMTATGGPWSSRPLAARLAPRARLRAFGEPPKEAARRGVLERFATAGQARIGHEIFVGIEGFLARRRLYARRAAVRQERPALFVVHQVGHHDLSQHLLVHGRVEDGAEHL